MRKRVELLVGVQRLGGVGQEPHLLVKTGPESFLVLSAETGQGHCGEPHSQGADGALHLGQEAQGRFQPWAG